MKNILGLALCLAMASPAFAQEQPRRVVVTGEGVVVSVPDMAIVRLGVSAQKESASDAMEATSHAMTAILERFGTLPRRTLTSRSLLLLPSKTRKLLRLARILRPLRRNRRLKFRSQHQHFLRQNFRQAIHHQANAQHH